MYRLLTFGGLSLENDTKPVAASAIQRRRLALLVLLAGSGGRGVTRDRIFGYLWPDRPQDNARHALEQLLYATRRDLGKGAVLSSSGILRLDPLAVSADVVQFGAALERGALEEAVALYTGPFLDGVYLDAAPDFERWVDNQRLRLQERFAQALEQLARGATTREDLRVAVAWWRRLAGADPHSPRITVELMRALAAAGDPVGALKQARIFEELVRDELDIAADRSVLSFAAELRRAPPAARKVEVGASTAEALFPGRTSLPASEPQTPPEDPPVSRPPRRLLVPGWAVAVVALTILGIGALELLGGDPSPAAALAQTPPPDERATVHSPDAGARELYMRGRIAWNRRSSDGLEQAVVLFRQATERDPGYAEAYVGLADAYVLLGYLGFRPGDATFPKGKAAALQALALDPTVGAAYAALGKALQWERRWKEAEQAFIRALEYAPEHATGHQWYALLLTILDRGQDAVAHARTAAELDQLSIQIHNTYGIMLFNAGALDAALAVYERMVTNEPDTAWVQQNPWVMSNFGKVAAFAGRHHDALHLIEHAVKAVPGHPRPLYELAVAYILAGDTARAHSTFDRADPGHPHYTVYRALMHSWHGNLEDACEWLDRVEEWGPITLLTLSGDPRLKTLHAQPCYRELRRELGL